MRNCDKEETPTASHGQRHQWQKNNGVSIASVKKKLNAIQSPHPTVSPFRAGLRMINTKLLNNWRLKGVKQPLPWTLPTVYSLQINRFKSFLYIWSDPSPCKAFSSDSMQFMCVSIEENVLVGSPGTLSAAPAINMLLSHCSLKKTQMTEAD